MKVYRDLREFIDQLEAGGELKRVRTEVDAYLEMTELCDRVLKKEGPALLFERVKGHAMPVLGNLFGTPRRVALGMGRDDISALRELGELLAYLKEPDPPKGLKDAWEKLPLLKQIVSMAPKIVGSAPCYENVLEGTDVDLSRLPVQTCWPGDAGPLITWGARDYPRAAAQAPESRYLPHAGHRSESRHRALARSSRRRTRLSRSQASRIRGSPFRSRSRSGPIRRRSSAR